MICCVLIGLSCGTEGGDTSAPLPTPVAPEGPLCAQGAVDPPPTEVNVVALLGPDNYSAALALVGRYPQSAAARVFAAGLALHATPRNLPEAHRLYAEARVLADAGCTLIPRDQWRLTEGQALAHMLGQQFAPAVPLLVRAVEQFPNASSTRYNLACSYCMTGDLEGCHTAFVETLAMAAAGRHPSWVSEPERTVGHYVRLSAVDSDVASLRADPRYEQAIAPYVGQP